MIENMCAQLLTPISTHSNRTIHFYNLAVFSFRLHAFQFVHGVRASVEFDMRANIFCVIACSLDALQFAIRCIFRRSTFLIFYYSFVSIPCVHVKLNANGDGEEERNSLELEFRHCSLPVLHVFLCVIQQRKIKYRQIWRVG